MSELPDHEFNQLVINARTFSLAPGRSSMNQYNRRSTTPPTNLLQNDISSSCVGNSTDLNQTSPILLHSSSPKLSRSFQDEDSGLASCKFSESLGGEASEEDRVVSDDAFLHCQTNHVRITPTFNPPYDEEVKIDSSTGDSSIESPRSETSVTHDEYNLMDEGTEMETLSYKETPQICESLPPRQSMSTRSNHERDCWDYMPQNNVKEPSEDESDDHPYQKQPVDKSINIQQYVRIDKDQPLFNGTRYMFDDSIRLGIHKDSQDAVEHQNYGLLDVNGNPKPKDLTSYQQLRKSPGGAENGSLGTILSTSTRCALSSTEGTRERKRRPKKDPVILAEDVSDDYKGDLPLEDILCFINGNVADKELHKETPTSNGLPKVETKTKKKQERNNKKEKHGSFSEEKKDEGKIQTNAVPISSEPTTASSTTGIHSKESVVKINEGNIIADLKSDDSEVLKSVEKSNHLGEHSNLGNVKKISDVPDLKTSKPDIESDSKMINPISKIEQVKIDGIKDGLLDSTIVSHDKVRSGGNSSVLATVVTPSGHTEEVLTPDLKREESFTEVKKKKKRVGGNNLANAVSSHTRNFNSNVTVYRNHLRQKPSGTLVSGHLATNVHSLVVNDQPHAQRDLSPSSFPSLSGTGQRRNSCGEFDTDAMENRNLYDSDRESVKSLPVTHGGRPSTETYPVSYATMVAAPPRYDSNTSPSSESGVASGSQNSSVDSNIMQTPTGSIVIAQPFPNPNTTPERKPTVWKGSPRERRHSIGSSPEDKAEIESISQRNRQKSGSQEIFTRDIHLENTNNEASEGGEICGGDNPASSHLLGEDVIKPVKIVSETNHLATETFVISPLPSNVCQVSSSASRGELASTHIPQPSKPLQSSCDKMGLEQKVLKSKVEQPALHPVSSATKVTGRAGKNKHVSLIVDTTKKCNSNSGNNTKSVVFLDKRFSHCPQDLGITFGFDLESMPHLTSPVMSHSQPTSDITTIPITSAVTSSQQFSHIPPLSGAANKSDLCVSSISNKSLVHKDPHLEGHCNGLILPCTAGNQSIVVNSCDHRTNAQIIKTKPPSNDGVSQQIVPPVTNISTCTSKVNSGKSAPNQSSGSASVGLIYSPNHPPPTISQGEFSTIAKSHSTASATTSLSLPASASKPNKVSLTATATDQLPLEVKRQVNSVKNLAPGEAKIVNQGVEAVNTLISVVYGLKIEPKAGCGKLLFEPPNVIKGGVNSTEMSSFLKKKWSEISDKQKNGSNAFKTYSEDEENAVKQ